MKNPLWLLASLLALSACQKEIAPNEDTEALYWRFHGKYAAVSSISSEAVDVNLDRRSTFDLLEEMADLSSAILEIRVNRFRRQNPGSKQLSNFSFTQAWPEQSLLTRGPYYTDPANYEPNILVNYLMQGVSHGFDFDPAITVIQLRPNERSSLDTLRWPPPESITLQANDDIRVVTRKRLYTSQGWKTVGIVTLYRRYTMTT